MRSVRAPAPQVQPLVEFLREFMGFSHFRTVRIWGSLEIFGAYFGQFPDVSMWFPSVSMPFSLQGHSTRRESGFRAQRGPESVSAVETAVPWQRRHRRDSFVGVSFGLEAADIGDVLEIPQDIIIMFFIIRYHKYTQLCHNLSCSLFIII